MSILNPKQFEDYKELFENPEEGLKACLLVFVNDRITRVSGSLIRKLLNDFDMMSANENRQTKIFYPIISEDADSNNLIKKLWQEFNDQRLIPFFVFTDLQGFETGISEAGMTTADILLEKLRLIVPNP